jgi:DNA-binding protein HU-beta
MAKAKRTTHRSRKGKKLYAVRDKKGRFKDIQTYERAHRADIARTAKAEGAKKGKKAVRRKKAKKGTR